MSHLTENPLENDSYYMHIKTGSVDAGRCWFKDYLLQTEEYNWDEWERGCLVHVKNIDDEWVEA